MRDRHVALHSELSFDVHLAACAANNSKQKLDGCQCIRLGMEREYERRE
jgi:hypothetical protein